MKFKLIENINENLLYEDKVIKFNGETFPNFGWCVIMCGAPGGGKSTVLKNLVTINAKIYNVDDIKEFAVKYGNIENDELNILGKNYQLDDIQEPYDLSNSEYVSFLHKNLKPLNKKIKKNIFSMGDNAENGRLPNIAFDITGSEIDDFENIIFNLAPIGYKFAIVWVFNTIQNSLDNNAKRTRSVLKNIVLSKYFDVLATVPMFMNRRDLIKHVNDFWIVLPVNYNLKTPDGRYKYIKSNNVKKIDISSGIGELTSELVDVIYDSQQDILRKYQMELNMDNEEKNSELPIT